MRKFLDEVKERVLVYDGSKGYLLQQLGLKGGECGEYWNISDPEKVKSVYRAYKEAGADVIQTNTFPGNRANLEKFGLGDKTYEINYEGARLAREVMGRDGFVAGSVGPTGKLFEPSGELTFEHAYEIFREQVQALVDGGVDLINFETFTDLAEMRAALLAARETANIPVICSLAFEANGRTLMGTDPYTAAVILKSLGADLVGINCSYGPAELMGILKEMNRAGVSYLCFKPNAGLPEVVDGCTVYRASAKDFSDRMPQIVENGVRLIGGCCGTTPEFIKAVRESLSGLKARPLDRKVEYVIASPVKRLSLHEEGLQIGILDLEKDEKLALQLSGGDPDEITDWALDVASEGYNAVYIRTGKTDGRPGLLAEIVNIAQGYIREPFIIETEDPQALESALRVYRGKAGVILDDYPAEIKEELLRASMKYGSTLVNRGLVQA